MKPKYKQLTLHSKTKIFHLIIVNNTTYSKMTHSSHSISMPSQPSIHLKKGSHTLRLYFSIFYIVVDEHSHYIFYLHDHYHHSLWYKLFHTQDWNNFCYDSHKTKSTLWKYLHVWHGPTKNSRLCNNVQKVQKRLDQLHLAPFQQKPKENKIDFLANRESILLPWCLQLLRL